MRDLLRLFRLWRPAFPWLLLALLASLVTTLADLALMTTAGWFVTAMAAAGLAGQTMNYFTPSAIIRFTAIVRTGGRWVDRVVGHEATFRLLARTRGDLFRRLETIAPAGLEELRSADVAAQLKLDVDRLELVFLRLVAPIVVAVVVGAITGVAVLRVYGIGPGLAVAGLFALGGFALPLAAMRAIRRAGGREAEAEAALRRAVGEHVDGLSASLPTGDADRRARALEDRLAARLVDERRIAVAEAAARAGQGASRDAAVIVLVAATPTLLGAGALAGPDVTALLLLTLAAFEAIAPVAGAAAGLPATLASLHRLFAVWDRSPVVEDPPRPRPLPAGFDLACEKVSFRRPERPDPILADVDLVVPEGAERVISRPSGWGKSTLADLLLRVRDPDAGAIRLGGVDLRDLALADLRRVVALVPQHPHVFAASLGENLRAFAPEASEAELERALDAVGLARLRADLPEGLATFVGERGAALSGGEARRLALARVLLRPEVRLVVLDEPTEHLDPQTARAVIAGLRRATAGKSRLVFAHRRAGEADPWDEAPPDATPEH